MTGVIDECEASAGGRLALDTAVPGLQTVGDAGGPMASERQATWPLARALAWVVLAVMTVAVLYTGWIAIANFNQIGV
jgi:hypothetical protein